jgi:hypothetical protein
VEGEEVAVERRECGLDDAITEEGLAKVTREEEVYGRGEEGGAVERRECGLDDAITEEGLAKVIREEEVDGRGEEGGAVERRECGLDDAITEEEEGVEGRNEGEEVVCKVFGT